MPETWHDRQSRAIDYHPARSWRGCDYTIRDVGKRLTRRLFKRLRGRRLSSQMIWNVDGYMEEDGERTICLDYGDYQPYYGPPQGHFSTQVTRRFRRCLRLFVGALPVRDRNVGLVSIVLCASHLSHHFVMYVWTKVTYIGVQLFFCCIMRILFANGYRVLRKKSYFIILVTLI